MKKILLITMLLFGALSMKAQCDLPYKSLQEFNNDTTAFFVHNFINRADCYKGKTLKEVVNDMQLPMKWGKTLTKGRMFDISIGVNIGVNTGHESLMLRGQNKSTNIIYIYWEEELSIDMQLDYDVHMKRKAFSNYLDMYKNCKIKEIEATPPAEPKYLNQVKNVETRNEMIRQRKLYEESISEEYRK